MSKKIVIIKTHRDEAALGLVRETAAKYGYTVEVYGDLDEAKPHLEDAEIVHGMGMGLLANAPNAKWYCIASAGLSVSLQGAAEYHLPRLIYGTLYLIKRGFPSPSG